MQNPTTSAPSFLTSSHHPTQAQPHSDSTQAHQEHQYDQFHSHYRNPDQIDINADFDDYVPDSQGGNEDDYQGDVGDMTHPRNDGAVQHDGEAYHGREEQHGYAQHGHGGYYQQDGGPGYRGPTPDSEHGEGAITLYQRGAQAHVREGRGGEGRMEFEVNPYATQGEPGRGLQGYPSVRIPDQVLEPLSPLDVGQNLPHSHHHQQTDSSEGSKIASARAKGQFIPPKHIESEPVGNEPTGGRKNEKVGVEEIGGRRVLVRRVGTKHAYSEDEEEERAKEEIKEPEEFDPTAPIIKFDAKKALVEEWEKIQKEMVPFLKTYCEEKVAAMFNEILYVCNLFYQLNEDARKDLEEGVKKIEAEEKKQEECRKVIVDFSNQMQSVAAALSQFGGGGSGAALVAKEGVKTA